MNALHGVGETAGERVPAHLGIPQKISAVRAHHLASSRAGNVAQGEERGFSSHSEPMVKPTGRQEKSRALWGKRCWLAAGAGEQKRAQSVGRGGACVVCDARCKMNELLCSGVTGPR